ncbi:MAG: hypothetical protein RL616_2400, partial [Verrucomicrobiota bacterium]
AALNFAFAKKIFRPDIFEAAKQLRSSTTKKETSRKGRAGRKEEINESFAAMATFA